MQVMLQIQRSYEIMGCLASFLSLFQMTGITLKG